MNDDDDVPLLYANINSRADKQCDIDLSALATFMESSGDEQEECSANEHPHVSSRSKSQPKIAPKQKGKHPRIKPKRCRKPYSLKETSSSDSNDRKKFRMCISALTL